MKRKKGYFSISAVAKMFSVHPQTVRLYEKEGLIAPKRSDGNTRMFSEDDVDRLEEVIYLTHELGINLAGVEMILKLKRQIRKLQGDMNKAFKETEDELTRQEESSKAMAKKSATKLLDIKKQQAKITNKQMDIMDISFEESSEENAEHAGWDIEYEAD